MIGYIRIIVICALLSVVCLAATITVDDDGPADHNSIQQAVNAANDNDEIVVETGTYYESVDMLGKKIVLRSTNPTDPNIVSATIIDANNIGRCIVCTNFEDANTVINGFLVRNGNAIRGAGIYCEQSAPTITNCKIQNNTATEYGGGIYCNQSEQIAISFSELSNNEVISSEYKGGGGIYCVNSVAVLTQCTFTANSAMTLGGAYFSEKCDQTFSNCTFTLNDATLGGALACETQSNMNAEFCDFEENSAFFGGAVQCSDCNVTLTDSSFHKNLVFSSGAGIFCLDGDVNVTRCDFSNNESFNEGGAMACTGNDSRILSVTDCNFSDNIADVFGGAMVYDSEPNSQLVVADCNFLKNSTQQQGGGAFLHSSGIVEVTGCYFRENDANRDGGAIYAHGANTINVKYCTIVANKAKLNGGACFTDNKNLSFENCILTGNISGEIGGGLAGSASCTFLQHSIFWDNDANHGNEIALDHQSILHAGFCNIEGGKTAVHHADSNSILHWRPGNIDTNPLFVADGYWDPNDTPSDANDDYWVEGDYHLKSEGWRWDISMETWVQDNETSRCIDAGNPGTPLSAELTTIPGDPNHTDGINLRANIGLYGETAQASMPPHNWTLLTDITNDGTTTFADYLYLANDWLQSANEQPGDFDRNGKTDAGDMREMGNNWLTTTSWN